jgi:hypothetical protein
LTLLLSFDPADDYDLIEASELVFEPIFDFSALHHPQFVGESLLKPFQVLNLLHTGKVGFRIENLLNTQDKARTLYRMLPAVARSVARIVSKLGKFQGLDFWLRQPVFLFIDSNPHVALLNSLIIARVDDKIVFPYNFRSLNP